MQENAIKLQYLKVFQWQFADYIFKFPKSDHYRLVTLQNWTQVMGRSQH